MPGEKGITKLTNNLNSIRSGDQENYRSDTDDTSSIRGYISVFFRYVTLGGNEFIELESVSGGYQVLDSSVSIRAQSVHMRTDTKHKQQIEGCLERLGHLHRQETGYRFKQVLREHLQGQITLLL